jgi:hypothetical protein
MLSRTLPFVDYAMKLILYSVMYALVKKTVFIMSIDIYIHGWGKNSNYSL